MSWPLSFHTITRCPCRAGGTLRADTLPEDPGRGFRASGSRLGLVKAVNGGQVGGVNAPEATAILCWCCQVGQWQGPPVSVWLHHSPVSAASATTGRLHKVQSCWQLRKECELRNLPDFTARTAYSSVGHTERPGAPPGGCHPPSPSLGTNLGAPSGSSVVPAETSCFRSSPCSRLVPFNI